MFSEKDSTLFKEVLRLSFFFTVILRLESDLRKTAIKCGSVFKSPVHPLGLLLRRKVSVILSVNEKSDEDIKSNCRRVNTNPRTNVFYRL